MCIEFALDIFHRTLETTPHVAGVVSRVPPRLEHASSHSKLGQCLLRFCLEPLLSSRCCVSFSVFVLPVTFASGKGKRRPLAREPRELYYLARKSGSSRTIRWESWPDSMIQQGLFSAPCSWAVEGMFVESYLSRLDKVDRIGGGIAWILNRGFSVSDGSLYGAPTRKSVSLLFIYLKFYYLTLCNLKVTYIYLF